MLLNCFKYLLKETSGSFRSELINYICAHCMNMEPSLDLDKQIFRDMVKFYGETLHIPPLAAKIYSYLIFDFEKKGICFDEFVQVFAASKSSVSANLNLLLNAKLIIDFNTIKERKRFFRINENYMTIRFEEIITKMKQEISILDQLHEFCKSKDEEQIQRFEIYRTLLNRNIKNIEETLHKI